LKEERGGNLGEESENETSEREKEIERQGEGGRV
jgi:hypothetical protein